MPSTHAVGSDARVSTANEDTRAGPSVMSGSAEDDHGEKPTGSTNPQQMGTRHKNDPEKVCCHSRPIVYYALTHHQSSEVSAVVKKLWTHEKERLDRWRSEINSLLTFVRA